MKTDRWTIAGLAALAAVALAGSARDAGAYSTWTDRSKREPLDTNCAQCHGDYFGPDYVSLVDGQAWGQNLMDGHIGLLAFDCATCHTGFQFDTVFLGSSDGGNGLAPISCLGCHGRAETDAGGAVTGAGLRQHHWNAGVSDCQSACHRDADPALFTTVGEDVLPPYFANPGTGHPDIPTDPCNPSPDFTEDVLGNGAGLDNDGDGLYDTDGSEPVGLPPAPGDPICLPEPGGLLLQLAALASLAVLARRLHSPASG